MLKEIFEWSSNRTFKDQPVSKDKLISVMEAGRRAPSWKNIQPWEFIAVTGIEDKVRLAEIFAIGGLIKKAPAVILCVASMKAWERSSQHRRLKELLLHSGVTMSESDIDKMYLDSVRAQALAQNQASLMARTFENMGIAYGFMILEAANQGLGACILGEIDNELVTVNHEKYKEIKQYFGLDETHVITAGIILGVPIRSKGTTPRKEADKIYSFY